MIRNNSNDAFINKFYFIYLSPNFLNLIIVNKYFVDNILKLLVKFLFQLL